MKPSERCLHGVDNRVAEGEILFLRPPFVYFLPRCLTRMAVLSVDMGGTHERIDTTTLVVIVRVSFLYPVL